MNESKEQKIRLSERERFAYDSYCTSSIAPLSPVLQSKLFQLYLNGQSCEDIHRFNKQYTLGQIVAARIEGKWDDLLQEYSDRLLRETASRAAQVALESTQFICNLMTAANIENHEKILKFLQTRDPRDLGDLQIKSLSDYKRALEMLHRLTGGEKQTLVGEITHTHRTDPQATISTVPTPQEAESALKLLLGKKE